MPSFSEIHSQLKTIAKEGQHTLLPPTLAGQLILQLGKHSGGHLIKVNPYQEDRLLCRVYPPKSPTGYIQGWEIVAHDEFLDALKSFIASQKQLEGPTPTN